MNTTTISFATPVKSSICDCIVFKGVVWWCEEVIPKFPYSQSRKRDILIWTWRRLCLSELLLLATTTILLGSGWDAWQKDILIWTQWMQNRHRDLRLYLCFVVRKVPPKHRAYQNVSRKWDVNFFVRFMMRCSKTQCTLLIWPIKWCSETAVTNKVRSLFRFHEATMNLHWTTRSLGS